MQLIVQEGFGQQQREDYMYQSKEDLPFESQNANIVKLKRCCSEEMIARFCENDGLVISKCGLNLKTFLLKVCLQ